jgi:hypothetical protein
LLGLGRTRQIGLEGRCSIQLSYTPVEAR